MPAISTGHRWEVGKREAGTEVQLGSVLTGQVKLTPIRASASEHPDLFWALKGGGGNFGVVTTIAYRLYPITSVISGNNYAYFSATAEIACR